MYGETYSTKELRERANAIEASFTKADEALKLVVQSQEEYDEGLKNLQVKKLRELADLYTSIKQHDVAKGYTERYTIGYK